MGGGLSIINDNDTSILLRYSKDADIEEVIAAMRSAKQSHDDNISGNNIINDGTKDESGIQASTKVETINTNSQSSKSTLSNQNSVNSKGKLATSSSEGILPSWKKITSVLGRPSPLGTPRSSAKVITSSPLQRVKYGRRKSFSEDNPVVSGKKPISIKLTSVAPTTELTSETASASSSQSTADSWDSVSEQAFCNVCSMAFKSFPALDRHVKYSDLHSKNIAKLGPTIETNTNNNSNTDIPEVDSKAEAEKRGKMVEGKDFRLLYYGSKFFWKCKETIDIYIYYHTPNNCLELIFFDLQRNKELSRIYMDYHLLLDVVRADVILAVDAETSSKFSSDRFAVIEDRDVMIEKESRLAFIRYVINRLSYCLTPDESDPVPIVKFILPPTEIELSFQTPLLSGKPASLVPILVHFRRRSSADEIQLAMNALDASHKSLKQTIAQAETHQKRVSKIVDAARETLEAVKNRYDGVTKSKAQWLTSIRKVITQGAVEKTKLFMFRT